MYFNTLISLPPRSLPRGRPWTAAPLLVRPMLVLQPPLPTEYLQRAKGLSWVRDFR